jgi:hypothetical protein
LVTIEGVAHRPGVAKSMIYRSWPAKTAALKDAYHKEIEDEQ